MPTDAELREQLHREGDAPGSIDLDAVLRRARARRRPRVVAVAVGSSLAALAIVVPLSVGLALGQSGVSSASSGSLAVGSTADPDGDTSGQKAAAPEAGGPAVDGGAAAQKVNLCTGALAELAPAANGLTVTVEPVTASASQRDIPVTVTLLNGGATEFVGSASPFPEITLSRGGVVLWHSNGTVPSLAREIDLAPGASMTFSTTFEPLRCGVPDDERDSFRPDLPAVGPGHYELSAVLDVRATDGSTVRVSGSTTEVTLG